MEFSQELSSHWFGSDDIIGKLYLLIREEANQLDFNLDNRDNLYNMWNIGKAFSEAFYEENNYYFYKYWYSVAMMGYIVLTRRHKLSVDFDLKTPKLFNFSAYIVQNSLFNNFKVEVANNGSEMLLFETQTHKDK